MHFVIIAAVLAGATAAAPPTLPPQRLGLCAACHGERGVAIVPDAPNLAGQRLDYLRIAFKAYQAGTRDVAAMRAAAGMINAVDAESILSWYAAQPVASNAESAP